MTAPVRPPSPPPSPPSNPPLTTAKAPPPLPGTKAVTVGGDLRMRKNLPAGSDFSSPMAPPARGSSSSSAAAEAAPSASAPAATTEEQTAAAPSAAQAAIDAGTDEGVVVHAVQPPSSTVVQSWQPAPPPGPPPDADVLVPLYPLHPMLSPTCDYTGAPIMDAYTGQTRCGPHPTIAEHGAQMQWTIDPRTMTIAHQELNRKKIQCAVRRA